jgi:ribosomal-protein-alanine N-acetyltransferase
VKLNIARTIILESEHLRLRIPSLEDIPHIFSATRYAGFNDGILWEAPNSQEELIEPYHNSIKAWEEGKGYGFTIEDKETSEFLGRISIRKTETEDRWNVGFWTHPEHQKKGIMTASLRLILEFGFDRLNADVIESSHAIWNKASEHVLKRNGMKFIAYREKGLQKNGNWVDENLLAIAKEEWNQLKSEKDSWL